MGNVCRRCEHCEKWSWMESHEYTCGLCGESVYAAKTSKPLGTFGVNADWKPYISENLGHDPVVVKSRQHWREELRRRGLKNEYYDENVNGGA